MKINNLKKHIKSRIDHYTPYRPIIDSKEARLVREELGKVLELIEVDEQ